MEEIINYLQLSANAFALVVAGVIYSSYIKNLNAIVKIKDEQIKTCEINLKLWKDKADDFEKSSPAYVEKVLNDRIKIREEEIARLDSDKELHQNQINSKNEEVARLKSEIEKSKELGRTMRMFDLDIEDDDLFSKDGVYEVEEIGEVAVDSGQLMITDPCYIDSEWSDDKLDILRLYRDIESNEVFQYGKDFKHYDEKINGYDVSVNELIKTHKFEEVDIDYSDKITFSYAGACYTTLSKKGYGEMPFKLGHMGAGVVISTLQGDGFYPVYVEKYDGKIVRVYFNVY